MLGQGSSGTTVNLRSTSGRFGEEGLAVFVEMRPPTYLVIP